MSAPSSLSAAFGEMRHPHRRYNTLNGEWVLVSPQRTQRPWQGQVERPAAERRPAYDPPCYLCPGNARAGGARSPDYAGTYVFTNDFAALLPDAPAPDPLRQPCEGSGTFARLALLRAESESGTCRVICFSPRHDLTLPQMPVDAIRQVVDVWAGQVAELGQSYRWVQVFENKKELDLMVTIAQAQPACYGARMTAPASAAGRWRALPTPASSRRRPPAHTAPQVASSPPFTSAPPPPTQRSLPAEMELYLIRHAQSTNNALADIRQRVCDPPLSELGRRQAERLAQYLAGRRDDLGITRLYCSPMWRCLQTARPVGQTLGLRPAVWKDLHEFGGVYLDDPAGGTVGFSGKTRAEMLHEFPDYDVPAEITEHGWWSGPRESYAAGVERAGRAAARLRQRIDGDERIAILSHGDFLDALIKELLGQRAGPEVYYLLDNASLSHLRLEKYGYVEVRFINRTAHLSGDL